MTNDCSYSDLSLAILHFMNKRSNFKILAFVWFELYTWRRSPFCATVCLISIFSFILGNFDYFVYSQRTIRTWAFFGSVFHITLLIRSFRLYSILAIELTVCSVYLYIYISALRWRTNFSQLTIDSSERRYHIDVHIYEPYDNFVNKLM